MFTLSGCFGEGILQTKSTYGLDETFKFDDLDLTFKSDFVYGTIDNEFSEHDGERTFGIPVLMKNYKDEPHSLNMFFYDCYGPNGSKVSNVSAFFPQGTSMDWGGNILSGATAIRYLYFRYTSEGEYCVILDNYSKTINVKFQVSYGN